MRIGFINHDRQHECRASQNAFRYSVHADSRPISPWLKISGPGRSLRLRREGSADFYNFSELAKSIVTPEMSDREKALAVHHFCVRHFYNASMGWGDTDMTRFINGIGYSFCWGQADAQHLLFEAAGLRARAPRLAGHSSVEVWVDGKWRTLDAQFRITAPDEDLAGWAGGDELRRHPEIFDALCPPSRAEAAKTYWGGYAPGNTYEPHADSNAMRLTLRRGESVRFDLDRREHWALAPLEPADYCNGQWLWHPVLDDECLANELLRAENVRMHPMGFVAVNPSSPARIACRIACPWPLIRGSFALRFSETPSVNVERFDPVRHDWIPLHHGTATDVDCILDEALSTKKLATPCNMNTREYRHSGIREILVRWSWKAPAVCRSITFDLTLQAHRPSLPALEKGENRYTLLAEAPGASVSQGWTEYPGLSVSNDRPREGESVRMTARVYNESAVPVHHVPLVFEQVGTEQVLGRTRIDRIEPNSWGEASVDWTAAIHGDRPPRAEGDPNRYLSTLVRARMEGTTTPSGNRSATAITSLVVLASSPPRIDENFVRSFLSGDGETLTLRAAVWHPLDDADDKRLLYLQDSGCSATLCPFSAHPGKNGKPLAECRRIERIPMSEFAVAEWEIPQKSLPENGTVWIEMRPDESEFPSANRTAIRHQTPLKKKEQPC